MLFNQITITIVIQTCNDTFIYNKQLLFIYFKTFYLNYKKITL